MKHKRKNKIINIILIVIIFSLLWIYPSNKIVEAWKNASNPKNLPNNYMSCESPKRIQGVPTNTIFLIKKNNLYKHKPGGILGKKISDGCAVHGKYIEQQRNKTPYSKLDYMYKSNNNAYCIYSKTSSNLTNTFGGNPSCPAALKDLKD